VSTKEGSPNSLRSHKLIRKRPEVFAKGNVYSRSLEQPIFIHFSTETCFLEEGCNASLVDFMEVKGTKILR